ncbi:MAG: hypothetical protein ACREKE_00810 [bacterium]
MDMSLPPEQRHRKKRKVKGKGTKGVIAQLGHANGNSEINKKRREWEKKNKRQRRT